MDRRSTSSPYGMGMGLKRRAITCLPTYTTAALGTMILELRHCIQWLKFQQDFYPTDSVTSREIQDLIFDAEALIDRFTSLKAKYNLRE